MPVKFNDPSASEELSAQLKARDRTRRRTRAAKAAAERSLPPVNDLLPNCPRVMLRLDDLKPANRRLRRIVQKHLASVKGSLARNGFIGSILVRSPHTIVDGHVRCEAARQLGMTEVPALLVDHLSDLQVRDLAITMNRTAEGGFWELDALESELGELQVAGIVIEDLGFSLTQLDALCIDDDDPPDPPAPSGPAVSVLGDHWVMNRHELICADARNNLAYKALMGTAVARVLLTDEPYNVRMQGHVTSGDHREFPTASGEMSDEEFDQFHRDWFEPAIAHLMEGGLFATFIDWRSVDIVIRNAKALGLAMINMVVWGKTQAGMGSLWRSQHELLPFFKKGAAPHINNVELGKHARHRSNLWTYPGANTFGSQANQALADHPTPKPVQMLEDALRDITERRDIVLDPFLGSGSMLLAAERTGRSCRGIELDPLYVDLAVRRWEALTGKSATLKETGQTFHEVAAARAITTIEEGES